LISLKNISKTFDNGKNFVLHNISFDINPHEIFVILGSSGSGKSTLLKLINRLIDPTEGEIYHDGKDISDLEVIKLRRSIGYVLQKIGLFPHMTVEENLTIVLRLNKIPKLKRKERAIELLRTVNLNPDKFLNRFPDELSGGQNQRIAVARALASEPNILLMDEPFGALDAINRSSLQNELLDLNQRLHKTIVFVTHDIFEAMRLGDRILVMNAGKIEQIGTKDDILNRPETSFVESLFAPAHQQVSEFSEQVE